jgi:hypothetical protein
MSLFERDLTLMASGAGALARDARRSLGVLMRAAALALAVMVVILLPAGSRAGYASSQTERLARVCTAVHGAPPATLSRYCAARGW